MKTFYRKVLSVVVLGALPMLSTPAAAGMDSPCLDGNMDTCIIETPLYNGTRVGYSIENNLEQRLFAFGVTNTAEYGNSYSDHAGWQGSYISASAWNAGQYTFEFFSPQQVQKEWTVTQDVQVLSETVIQWEGSRDPSMVWVSGDGAGPGTGYGLQYTHLGTFETLFGTQDDHVSFFWNENLYQDQLTTGVTLAYNYLNSAEPKSDFSTFDALGNVVTTSVTAVPEPETYAMFLAGLGLLGVARRNKRA